MRLVKSVLSHRFPHHAEPFKGGDSSEGLEDLEHFFAEVDRMTEAAVARADERRREREPLERYRLKVRRMEAAVTLRERELRARRRLQDLERQSTE